MKKKIIYSILLVSLFFFNVNIVFAENSTSCAYQQQQINSYNSLKTQLESIDCTDTSTESTVTTCNENQMEQNVIITELMKLNDEGNICSSLQDDVDSIIEENEDRCGQIFDSDFSDFIDRCMAIFYILGPILLILFGSLDFARATVSGDEKSLRKAWKTFSKRIAATLLLFLTPFIVNVIVSLNLSDKYLSGNAYSCDYSYNTYIKLASFEYVESTDSSSSSISSSYTTTNGYVIFAQSDQRWGSDRLLVSSENTIASAGCALTSVAMAIVNSGVETVEEINPGTLNEILINKDKAELNGGNMPWAGTRYATNNKFVYYKTVSLSGKISSKRSKLQNYLNQGYYPVIQVKYGTKGNSHFVVVFKVTGNHIIAGDPAGGGHLINLEETSYPIVTKSYSSNVILYEIVD